MWSHQIPGKVNLVKALNDTVVVGGEDGVYLFDYDKNRRGFHATDAAVTSVRVLEDGKTVITTSDGTIRMLGGGLTPIWERTIPGYVGYDSAIDAVGGLIVCGSMDGYVYVFDNNGTYLWKHLIGSYVTNVRLLVDRIVAASDRQVYILDLDGRVRRNLDLTGYVRSAKITDTEILVGMSDGVLYAYNVTGGLTWNLKLNQHVSAIDVDGDITVGTRDKQIIRLRGDGVYMWVINVSDAVVSVRSDGGDVVAATLDGRVYAYNSRGVLVWYYEAEGRPSALSVSDGRVLAGTTVGRIYYSKIPRIEGTSSLIFIFAAAAILAVAFILAARSWR